MTAAADAIQKLNELASKVGEVISQSPAGDLERNAKQHFISQLAKQGLVTREEFDAQRALLARLQAKLDELERRIAEHAGQAPPSAPSTGSR